MKQTIDESSKNLNKKKGATKENLYLDGPNERLSELKFSLRVFWSKNS